MTEENGTPVANAESFRELVEHSGELIQSIGPDGQFTYVNPQWCRSMGYTLAEARRLRFTDILRPDQMEHCQTVFSILQSGVSVPFLETVFLTKDGREILVEGSTTPTLIAGRLVRSHGFFTEVTERRGTEERARLELRESRSQFQAILDGASDAILTVDADQRITLFNHQAERMFGYQSGEVLGQPLTLLMTEGARDAHGAHVRHFADEGSTRRGMGEAMELSARRRGGEEFPIEVTIASVFSGGRTVLIAIVRDITERRRDRDQIRKLNAALERTVSERTAELREREEQLRQAQKLEAIGRLAGGIAHDFNNILTVMQGYGELLLNELDATDPRRYNAESIHSAAESAGALVQQLLAFSRKQVLRPEKVDLKAVVNNVERMLVRLIGDDVQVAVSAEPELPPVEADVTQMEQIILNLAVNARDAMPEGGQLDIEIASVTLDEDTAVEGCAPGRYVSLVVSDTGVGMDADTQALIFDPFFTTKEVGRGTGLGLASVHGTIKQSGGGIEVESAPGHGTTFRIYLPAADGVAAAERRSFTVGETPAGGSGTILVAEDDLLVRRLVTKALQAEGYTVLEAPDGNAALQTGADHTGSIDLLITDVFMPGIGGKELARSLLEIRPEMRVIYMSGVADQVVAWPGIIEGEAHFLAKPFALDVLTGLVRDVLGAVVEPPHHEH